MATPPRLPPERSGGHPRPPGAARAEPPPTAPTPAAPSAAVRALGRMSRGAAVLLGVAIGAFAALGMTVAVALGVRGDADQPADVDGRSPPATETAPSPTGSGPASEA
ncbi:MAG TPA: hypothetical protein VML55_18290, partial [Planctomycetaceae bacterium]|nr:hypothetical protein [Planctomycetaceae bacterium]